MATYFAKIDHFQLPDIGGHGRINVPKKASELPERGDELFIWTNEKPNERNLSKEKGVGLTALGIVANAAVSQEGSHFLVEFELLAKGASPLGNKDWDTCEGLAPLRKPFREYTHQKIATVDSEVTAAFLRSQFLQY
jgi:hypothetical protein